MLQPKPEGHSNATFRQLITAAPLLDEFLKDATLAFRYRREWNAAIQNEFEQFRKRN